MDQKYFRKMLQISTGHVAEATAKGLDKRQINILTIKHEHGWFVWVDDQPDDSVPADLVACLNVARQNGCSWINFDCDSEKVPDLQLFDW